MYKIENAEFTPGNFIAGDFPIKTDFGAIKSGAIIHKYAPVVQGADGITELTKDMLPVEASGETPAAVGMLDKLTGIAADEPNGGEVVYYLTGEFFSEALFMPDGITSADIKPTLRKLGIFLKEMKNNG